MARTRVETRQAFTSEPRTAREREVFDHMVVDADGVALFLPACFGPRPFFVVSLRDTAAVATLIDLLTSAHRRLSEIEIAAVQRGTRDPGDAATPPVGTGAS